MLYGHGCFQEISIGILIVRSLLTIINLNKSEMHDLLRDMGREIAREMSPDQENTAEFSFPRMYIRMVRINCIYLIWSCAQKQFSTSSVSFLEILTKCFGTDHLPHHYM